MINIDKRKAKTNIEEIVRSMGFKQTNYVFLKNKFITQEIMVYNENKIVTFFVKVRKKDFKLQKFCYKQFRHLIVHSFSYHLIVSRIKINEYDYNDFENIDFDETKNRLLFFGNSGWHSFSISKNDVYGFDQSEQIERLKEFVNKVNNIETTN